MHKAKVELQQCELCCDNGQCEYGADMAHQHDKGDADGSFPVGGGCAKDVKKLSIKRSFRSLSSPRKVDKGRLQTQSYESGVTTYRQHTQFQFVDDIVSPTAVVRRCSYQHIRT